MIGPIHYCGSEPAARYGPAAEAGGLYYAGSELWDH